MKIIADEKYIDFMNNTVTPALASRCRSGYFPVDEHTSLYYEYYLADHANGSIVISHGFAESLEKYKEVTYYFLLNHYHVFLIDHRGHGHSSREEEDISKVHVSHFSDYAADLHSFLQTIAFPVSGKLPFYLYAHSMGGAIGALFLETYPNFFSKAVLSAPLLRMNTGSIPAWTAFLISAVMKQVGKDEQYVMGQGAYCGADLFEASGSACQSRFSYYAEIKRNTSYFQTNGADYRWLFETLRILPHLTSRSMCRKVQIPVLLFEAERDDYVQKKGMQLFAKRTPNAQIYFISDSKHEIYQSTASVLESYYDKILSFYSS